VLNFHFLLLVTGAEVIRQFNRSFSIVNSANQC
jgi:hypothetical protein